MTRNIQRALFSLCHVQVAGRLEFRHTQGDHACLGCRHGYRLGCGLDYQFGCRLDCSFSGLAEKSHVTLHSARPVLRAEARGRAGILCIHGCGIRNRWSQVLRGTERLHRLRHDRTRFLLEVERVERVSEAGAAEVVTVLEGAAEVVMVLEAASASVGMEGGPAELAVILVLEVFLRLHVLRLEGGV